MGKKIVFDARMYGLEHGGIGRYIMNILRVFGDLDLGSFDLILLVKKEKTREIKKDLGDKFGYVPVRSSHYSSFEQIEIPWVLKKIDPDLVHFPHFNAPFFYRGRCVVTIHDLIKHFFRGKETTTRHPWLYWPKYFAYRVLIREVVGRAEAIIVPTLWWKRKLVSFYKLPSDKIFVTGEGVDGSFLKRPVASLEEKSRVLKKYGLNKKFLIYTGSVYPHKNVRRMIRAFLQLRKKKIKLAIVCSRSIFRERLESFVRLLGARRKVLFLGFVPDEELKILYSEAVAFVQPSLMEGFGLPALEAMSCGCPIVSSKASCLPEVYGEAALYFDPLDTKDITEKLKIILDNSLLRKKLIRKGREQVKKHTWEMAAQKTLDVYRKLLKN